MTISHKPYTTAARPLYLTRLGLSFLFVRRKKDGYRERRKGGGFLDSLLIYYLGAPYVCGTLSIVYIRSIIIITVPESVG